MVKQPLSCRQVLSRLSQGLTRPSVSTSSADNRCWQVSFLCRLISLRRQVLQRLHPLFIDKKNKGDVWPMLQTSEPRSRKARTKDSAVSWGRAEDRRDPISRKKLSRTFLSPSLARISWGKLLSQRRPILWHQDRLCRDITAEEFEPRWPPFKTNSDLFQQSHTLEKEIEEQMKGLKYEWVKVVLLEERLESNWL